MVRSTPPNPHRFVHHLPAGSKAASLEEALVVLTERYGEGIEQPAGEGLVAIAFEGEDKRIRVFRDTGSGSLIAILTQTTAVIQMFPRPCSGWAARVTGTGVATGTSLDIAGLTAAAQAAALFNLGRLLAGLPNLVLPHA